MLTLVLASTLATALALPVDRVRRDACSSFVFRETCEDESPEELKCVWATATPGNFDESKYTCQPTTCETLQSSMGDVEPLCKSDAACEWNAEVYSCFTKGASVPCGMYYPDDAGSCPNGCVYSALTEKCAAPGAAVVCDEVYDNTKCTANGCEWHDDIYKCWEKGVALPCVEYEYMEQASCPTTCKWVELGHGTYTTVEGRCMDKAEQLACEELYEKASCTAESSGRCEWHEAPLRMCTPANRAIPCERLDGRTCSASTQCTYVSDAGQADMGACADCKTPGDSCIQPWTGSSYGSYGGYDVVPDDGLPCSTHSGNECPDPRCFTEYPTADGGAGDLCGNDSGEATCRDPICTDREYDPDACRNLDGCKYDATSDACYSETGVFPCHQFFTEDTCTTAIAADKCTWTAFADSGAYADAGAGVCYITGAPPKCEDMDAYSADTCASGPQDPKCVWFAEIYSCRKADYVPPCNAFTNEGECPSPRCEKIQGTCWEVGQDVPCNALCSAFKCSSSGKCLWSEKMYSCSPCPAGGCPAENTDACSTFMDDISCPESRCEFMYYEDVGDGIMDGQCTDKVCADKYEKAECEATPKSGGACAWTSAGSDALYGSCFPAGLSLPCSRFYDADSCIADSCDWDNSNYRCNEKGEPTPCEYFSSNDCPADRCESPTGSYDCRLKGVPTNNVPDWENIAKHGDGTGNEDETSCSNSDFESLRMVLDEAEAECVTIGRRTRKDAHRAGRATEGQVECLQYLLSQVSSTIAKACPCLWKWGKEVDPYSSHWMELNC